MTAAGMVSVIFSCLKWPKVLGYILAGVLMSRNTWGGSFLVDESSVQTIGQIGIVFLMFSMGLGFSASEIRKTGGTVLPVAVLDMIVMMWIGFTIGRTCFGWGTVPSLFLGAAISDSATTLLAKTIDELKWTKRPFVRLALGASVCEDIICVGVIALVTGVAKGAGLDFGSVAKSLSGLGVFFVAVYTFGLILVPKALGFIARKGDDEVLLLSLLGGCFFVTYVAYKLDFSLALGAFLVGALGAGSDVRARLAKLVEPLRAMFASVFFVSIGLLVNPAECFSHLPAILAISAVVMAGKLVNCTIGAIACGESVKTSVQTGFSLAQIGEFGYMVALLYVTITGDVTKPMYQIVVGVSLLTTLLNPFMIRVSGAVGDFAESKCPAKIKKILEGYRGFLARFRSSEVETPRRKARVVAAELAVCAILIFAAGFALSILNGLDWSRYSVFFENRKTLFFCLAINVFLASIGTVISRLAKSLADFVSAAVTGAGEARWQLAMRLVVRFAVLALAFVAFTGEALMVNINLAPKETWGKLFVLAVILIFVAFEYKILFGIGRRAYANFTEALKTDERLAELSHEVFLPIPEDSVTSLVIGANSPAAGLTVASLGIRAKTGASIFSVERDGKEICNIGPAFVLAAGDVLTVVGDGTQVAALKDLLGITA